MKTMMTSALKTQLQKCLNLRLLAVVAALTLSSLNVLAGDKSCLRNDAMSDLRAVTAGFSGHTTFGVTSDVIEPVRPKNPNDPRVEVTKIEGALTAIGAVFQNGRQTGSGTMVSKCHFLTSRHVVANLIKNERGSYVQDPNEDIFMKKNISFKLGLNLTGNGKFESNYSGKVVAAGKASIPGDDWAVIQLDDCKAGEKYQYMKIGRVRGLRFIENKDLDFHSFPGIFQEENLGKFHLFGQKKCHVITLSEVDTLLLTTTCAAGPGSSGGPVNGPGENGQILLLGIMAGASNNAYSTDTPNPQDKRTLTEILPMTSVINLKISKVIENYL